MYLEIFGFILAKTAGSRTYTGRGRPFTPEAKALNYCESRGSRALHRASAPYGSRRIGLCNRRHGRSHKAVGVYPQFRRDLSASNSQN